MSAEPSGKAITRTAFLGLIMFLAGFVVPAGTLGARIAVDSESDLPITTVEGSCGLRQAIEASQTDSRVGGCRAGSGADVILLPSGVYEASIFGANEDGNATGDFDVRSGRLTIQPQSSRGQVTLKGTADRPFPNPRDRVISNVGGMLTLRDLVVTDGSPEDKIFGDNSGGGIASWSKLILDRVSVVGNTTDTWGGGVFADGETVIRNSTIAGNSTTDDGGGLAVSGFADVEIFNSTIARNVALERGGGLRIGSRFSNDRPQGKVSVHNSIIAANQAEDGSDCFSEGSFAAYKLLMTEIRTSGHSCRSQEDGSGVKPVIVPIVGLGKLGKAGRTLGIPLLPGSPAIGAGGGTPGTSCLSVDQSGIKRGSRCDLGSVQYRGTYPFPNLRLTVRTQTESQGALSINATASFAGRGRAGRAKVCIIRPRKLSHLCRNIKSLGQSRRRASVGFTLGEFDSRSGQKIVVRLSSSDFRSRTESVRFK